MNRLRFITGLWFLAPLAAGALAAEPAPAPFPRFHDPSTPVRQDDRWWIFSTGNGIATRHSNDLKSWTEGEPVFKSLPEWHREVVPDHKGHLWAPDIIRQGDRFLLYYSVSSWGKNSSAIGLASNTSLDPKDPGYEWKDQGIVLRSGPENDYNAIDPQLFSDDDGSLWMAFGSFWKGIKLVELDPASGHLHASRNTLHHLAWNKSIEAPAILKHGDHYYLFVNWGLCCRGVDSTYEIRVGRSREITGPYLDAEGEDMATGGGTLFAATEGDRIGPGHPAFVEQDGTTRMFFHYYDRRRNGFASLGNLPLKWDAKGWPGK
jgi:arabinan endo-1,5-alpha-L-arabinosidase